MNIDRDDLMWLAGLAEGECWFGSRKDTGLPRLSLESVDRDICGRAATLLGGKVRARMQRNDRCQPTFVTEVSGTKAVDAMQMLLPHMGSRRSARIMQILYGYEVSLQSTAMHAPPGIQA